MSHLNADDIDMKYYYNRKSKFFEDFSHRDNSTRTITIDQFLKFLSLAYLSETSSEEDEFDYYMNTDFVRVTRVELFSELVDIDEGCLYGVINESDNVREMKLTNEHDLFSYCDYFLNIPSCTNLTTYSDTSKESSTSLIEEPVPLKIDDKELGIKMPVTSSISLAGLQSAVPRNESKSKFEKINTQTSGDTYESNHCKVDMYNQSSGRNESFSTDHMTDNIMVDKNRKFFKELFLTIHVKDIRKKHAKNYQISKELLLSKMGYFADKNLSKAKISIHCDLKIFHWIMEWLFQSDPSRKSQSLLNSKNVIQCLVCVSLLQIEELINVCLYYCKNNMNEVIKSTKNFSCLDDNILDKLANLFSNVDVEALEDRKHRIQSILYCKLIMSLALPEPEPWKGHFSSLTTVFKCTYCKKMVMYKIANLIPCLHGNVQLNINGEISIIHAADPNWTLTEYIGNLRRELKSWRKVYWRLWAECHYLYCTECKSYYSVYYYDKCFYHPKDPQFSERKQAGSGYYPCCGAKSYQYECVVHFGRGCKTKNHSPVIKNNRISTDVMKLLERFHRFIFSAKSNDSHRSNYVVIGTAIKSRAEHNIKLSNNVHSWKLPYFTSKHKPKGLLGHGFCNTKQNNRANGYECWIPDALNNYYVKTSSSVGLFTNANDKKLRRTTLVGMLMQLEGFESETNEISETSLSTLCSSEIDLDVEESTRSREDIFDTANSDTNWNTERLRRKRYITSERYTTRINQDNQREYELSLFILANSYLTHKKHKRNSFTCFSNKNLSKVYNKISVLSDMNISMSSTSVDSLSSSQTSLSISGLQKPAIWSSHTPFPGTYLRIESEWKREKKFIANVPSNIYSPSHVKMCTHCKDQTMNRKQPHTISLRYKLETPHDDLVKKKSLSFDIPSHVEYHSAVYKPISLWKEYKMEKYRLNVDWPTLLALEQKWSLFLKLIDVNELSTFENT